MVWQRRQHSRFPPPQEAGLHVTLLPQVLLPVQIGIVDCAICCCCRAPAGRGRRCVAVAAAGRCRHRLPPAPGIAEERVHAGQVRHGQTGSAALGGRVRAGGSGALRTCCASPPWLPLLLLPLERPRGVGYAAPRVNSCLCSQRGLADGGCSEAAQGRLMSEMAMVGRPPSICLLPPAALRLAPRPPTTSCSMHWRAAHQPTSRTPVHATDPVQVYMPRTEVSRQGSGAGRKSGGRPHSAPAYIAHG